MKTMNIYRGKSKTPMTLADNDKYDSRLDIIDETVKVLCSSELINTDPSVLHPGGILAPGKFYGIYHEMFGYPAFVFFIAETDYTKITDWTQLTEAQRTFSSLVPNPNQGGQKIMTQVDFHIGCRNQDGSEGCQTYYPDEWSKFKIFQPNEIIKIELV